MNDIAQYLRNNEDSLDYSIQRVINSTTFNYLATVVKVWSNTRVDVQTTYLEGGKAKIIKGVELLHTGNKDVYVDLVPTIGDWVICFTLFDQVDKLESTNIPKLRSGFAPYEYATSKGILVSPTAATSSVKVEVDKELNVTLTTKKDAAVTVEGKLDATVSKDVTLTAEGKLDATVSKDVAITVKGKMEAEVTSTFSLKSSNGNMEVSSDSGGNLTVKAKKVSVNNGHLEVT